MSIQIKGFTPLFDSLLLNERYGVIGAAIFGKYWRYWAYYGKASASQERYAKELGISSRTVRNYIIRLVEDGYLEVINPEAKGIPFQYVPTQKVIMVLGVEEGTPERDSAPSDKPRKEIPTPPERDSYVKSNKESIKKVPLVFSDWMLSSPLFMQAWNEFVAYRKESKKTLTPLAANKIIKKLSLYDEQVSICALNRSIENSWTGVFPESVKLTQNGAQPAEKHAQRLPKGV